MYFVECVSLYLLGNNYIADYVIMIWLRLCLLFPTLFYIISYGIVRRRILSFAKYFKTTMNGDECKNVHQCVWMNLSLFLPKENSYEWVINWNPNDKLMVTGGFGWTKFIKPVWILKL